MKSQAWAGIIGLLAALCLPFPARNLKAEVDSFADGYGNGTPSHQVWLRSSLDLPHGFQFDLMGRFVDNLPGRDIPSYFSLNARLAWRPCPSSGKTFWIPNIPNPHPMPSPSREPKSSAPFTAS